MWWESKLPLHINATIAVSKYASVQFPSINMRQYTKKSNSLLHLLPKQLHPGDVNAGSICFKHILNSLSSKLGVFIFLILMKAMTQLQEITINDSHWDLYLIV